MRCPGSSALRARNAQDLKLSSWLGCARYRMPTRRRNLDETAGFRDSPSIGIDDRLRRRRWQFFFERKTGKPLSQFQGRTDGGALFLRAGPHSLQDVDFVAFTPSGEEKG